MSQPHENPLIHDLIKIPASALAASRNNPRLTLMLLPNDPDTIANDWELAISKARQAWQAQRHAQPDLRRVILGTVLFYQDCVRILVETRPQGEPEFYEAYGQDEFYTSGASAQVFDNAVRLASLFILESESGSFGMYPEVGLIGRLKTAGSWVGSFLLKKR
ncbi:hypothetical protein BO86DRAFT_394164 [Aspergillus japonicus CBS 114.51]|uniref:Uncharacterized protein n=1 Tax=Aspergillus japonicus CBS 114.51 TaxID=1448312 RepID=A0A8T8XG97_ASPJA|nr:hypothetical protein BO86DRAFT_394164 [Aspergillus japonicus CBS 114.51]RAH87363.1 hypothetical protein BO86DRAFT_394164 [Aspergillus japonicus CBS 114.51]